MKIWKGWARLGFPVGLFLVWYYATEKTLDFVRSPHVELSYVYWLQYICSVESENIMIVNMPCNSAGNVMKHQFSIIA